MTALNDNNGNYVVASPNWNGDLGAATWSSGTTGITGTISAANSLVGSTAGNKVGLGGVTALSNGNYVVDSPDWNGGTNNGMGAATWGSDTAGVAGTISAANSLVGSSPGDRVGSGGVTALTNNGNYVVLSPNANPPGGNGIGAVTWGDGATGITGTISSANSLVNTGGNNFSGASVIALSNGNYVLDTPNFENPGIGAFGAATWINGSAAVTGTFTRGNSLAGSNFGDDVGSGGVTALSNGNYVVDSPDWNAGMGRGDLGQRHDGCHRDRLGRQQPRRFHGYDAVGSGGVTALSNGDYVVVSPNWNGGLTDGAVTLGDGTAGTTTGTISAANSLVGASAGDRVGSGGVTALTNAIYGANYVVDSPDWHGGIGAVTGNGQGGALPGPSRPPTASSAHMPAITWAAAA